MKIIELPMFRENGTRVQLAELLGGLQENTFIWSVVEFDGVGMLPEQMSIAEFQARVNESPNGAIMSFRELTQFVKSIEYTIDCLIVGAETISGLDAKRLLADDFSSCEIVLRAIDSTDWILGARDEAILRKLVLQAS